MAKKEATKGSKVTKEVSAYCVKCQKKRVMANAKRVEMKNGRPAVKGECPKCGTGMYRIGEP